MTLPRAFVAATLALAVLAAPALSAAKKKAAPGADSKVAGLYLGASMVYTPTGFMAGSKWYLLSPDGRAHMGLKLPKAPGGDLSRFDYDAAKREAPQYAGTYTVAGKRVTIRLGLETVTGELNAAGDLTIRGTVFKHTPLK